MFLAGTLTGGLLAGRFLSIRLYRKLEKLRDETVAKMAEVERREREFALEQANASLFKGWAEIADREAKEARAALDSYLEGPDRARVRWLAEQLAAHLTPAGVVRLTGRESAQVDAEAGADFARAKDPV